jgi:hypothetical protein
MSTTAQVYTTREQKVLDVFSRHVAASTSGDLDAVLNDFDEHPLVIHAGRRVRGSDRAEQSAQRKFNRNGGAS